MTSKQPLYDSSTQARNWRNSISQLSATRSSLNQAAVSVIRHTFDAEEARSSSDIEFLNANEEHVLVKHYICKLTQLCGHFRFPEEVEATAITFLKRFYLKNTVMDWHPKNVMLTALFLATKTTNNPISLETYASQIKIPTSDILDLEFLVAQSLGFEFAVWHAHRSLWGIWLDIQGVPEPPVELAREIYDTALSHVRSSRLTDAELIYTPAQIALACFSLSSPVLATHWAQSKANASGSADDLFAESQTDDPRTMMLHGMLDAIKTLVAESGSQPKVDVVREVDRRLKLCKNPEKIVGSSAWKRKQAEDESKAAEKRAKKALEDKIAMENGDPFGESLGDAGGLDEDDLED